MNNKLERLLHDLDTTDLEEWCDIIGEIAIEKKGHFPYFFYYREKGTLPIFLLLTLLSSPYLLW